MRSSFYSVLFLLWVSHGSLLHAQVNGCEHPLLKCVRSSTGKNGEDLHRDSIQALEPMGHLFFGQRAAIIKGDTTLATLEAFEQMKRRLNQLPEGGRFDTFSHYAVLFFQERYWRDDLSGKSFIVKALYQKDSLVEGATFFQTLKTAYPGRATLSLYCFGKKNVVVQLCYNYIGENSWGWEKVFYLKKAADAKASKKKRV